MAEIYFQQLKIYTIELIPVTLGRAYDGGEASPLGLWVLHFQRATSSAFQTCIRNSHQGHTMCGSMVDIQSPTAEIRRGKKRKKKEEERIRKKKIEITEQKYNVRTYYIGRP